jgi:hypothetical protein
VVQKKPSSHGSVLGTFEQLTKSIQESSVQGLLSSQVNRGPPLTQTPRLQTSIVVQRFVSSQGVSFGRSACWHPTATVQTSTVHGLPSSQSGAGPPTQAPAWHASPFEHSLPSLQAVPSSTGGF